MTLSTQPYKGARDFYPEDKRLHNYLLSKMREVAERHGYENYDTPILEPLELYLSKSSSEIVNEQTYYFEDRGGRKVVIRPEMTPSLARLVAGRRQELAFPLRWYSIPNLWRYERLQKGRLREHYQLNVDIFGVTNLSAEHEIILIANDLLRSFGAKSSMYTINLSSRKLINYLLSDYLGLDLTQTHSFIRLIDHMHKMSPDKFSAEVDSLLTTTQRDADLTSKILDILGTKTLSKLPDEARKHPSVGELESLMNMLANSKIDNVKFDITLMRGFDYYTDIVFEINDNDPENSRSMFGGGRYDRLLEIFDIEPIPAVGFGMGDVTLLDFLEIHKLLPQLKTETDLYLAVIGNIYPEASLIADQLRGMGLNVAIDSSDSKVDKQIKAAVKKGIRYIIFVGEEELRSEQFKLKDLVSGEEETHGLEIIVSFVKDSRHN